VLAGAASAVALQLDVRVSGFELVGIAGLEEEAGERSVLDLDSVAAGDDFLYLGGVEKHSGGDAVGDRCIDVLGLKELASLNAAVHLVVEVGHVEARDDGLAARDQQQQCEQDHDEQRLQKDRTEICGQTLLVVLHVMNRGQESEGDDAAEQHAGPPITEVLHEYHDREGHEESTDDRVRRELPIDLYVDDQTDRQQQLENADPLVRALAEVFDGVDELGTAAGGGSGL
jgi:hypothetical protein